MWFKTNKRRLLSCAILGVVVVGFGCAQDHQERMTAKDVQTPKASQDEVKVDIVVQDERGSMSEAASVAPSVDQEGLLASSQAPGFGPFGGYGAGPLGGYPGIGYPGLGGYPGIGGPIGPDGPFGPGPWFGPGLPFVTADVLLFDDDNNRCHRRHRDRCRDHRDDCDEDEDEDNNDDFDRDNDC